MNDKYFKKACFSELPIYVAAHIKAKMAIACLIVLIATGYPHCVKNIKMPYGNK